MPRHVGRIGADASLEIGREDAGLDGHLAEQGRLDALAGRLGGEPRLVSEAGFDVVSELVGEPVGRRAIEIRLVLDRDDPLDPIGIRSLPAELNPVVPPSLLDQLAAGSAVDRLSNVAPWIAGMRERVAVPRPLAGGVANHVEEVGIDGPIAERTAGCERRRIDLYHDRVPAALFGAELAGDDCRTRTLRGTTPARRTDRPTARSRTRRPESRLW